ncbi:MAG TPA: GTPase domain-containing protein [Pirellulales bacterium]|nr:GTPase domain-containing protein [Pirellulales bacterium]
MKLRFALRLTAFGLPYAGLMILGLFWLKDRGWLLYFLIATSLLSLFSWSALRWLHSRPASDPATPPPSKTWPPAGEAAWTDVDRLAARVEANPPVLGDANEWAGMFYKVFELVAPHFHPRSKRPALEVPVGEVLKVAELVARDLRQYVGQSVPGAERITVHHLYQVVRWGPTATRLVQRAWNVVRLGRFFWNPASAIASETGSLTGGGLDTIVADVPGLAAGHCVRRTGKYAIDLYSGQLDLDEPAIRAIDAAKPLRIVVLGQAKAGKSSLINAIFGAVRAATDVLPCTGAITPYVLERDGLFKAIIYDTVGFGGADDALAQTQLNEELDRCDLVLVVSSAATAARESDRELLDDARHRLQQRVRRAMPPIVVALSHVDMLRPLKEWNPPYDFTAGDSVKERNVRDARQAVADDLQVPLSRVVPVCLRPDAVYNVNEALLPSLVEILPEAERAKLLRVLMENRNEQQRESLTRMLMQAGVATAERLLAGAQRWGQG